MERDREIDRRSFLAAPFLLLAPKTDRAITGAFVNDAFVQGHRLRDHASFEKPAQTIRIPVVIVGGGIAGLSAAWRLDKRGLHDFVLLEMEREPGGNSRHGENEITKYPWAAHYLPVPSKESELVRELCRELGVLDEQGKWNERYLCFSPQERLFLHGRWQEGIEPEMAATTADREQYKRFQGLMKEHTHGGQFTIPMEVGAKPSTLDSESMSQWMDRNRFDSPYLRWYVDYACRDDYGASIRDTSAWAGIHYFASRQPDDKGPLTWPEGNGWLASQLQSKLARYIRTNSPVYSIRSAGHQVEVLTPGAKYIAGKVIFAAPTFTAHYIVEGAPKYDCVYSPWLTANLTLDRIPAETGIESAWDNVIYNSPALGYVVATHMSTRSRIEKTVWTYYWSFAENTPQKAREALLSHDWPFWKEAILHDLERAHPDIRQCVSHIDIMRFGHAMARPVPGFLNSHERHEWATPKGNVLYANSDLSGFSIFEEAQYRGVKAADAVLKQIGKR
jgi:glycine/D-amino acid oxidase-like deaminating enzyme